MSEIVKNEFEKAVDDVLLILSECQKKWYAERNKAFGWTSDAEQYEQEQCDSAKSNEAKKLSEQQYERKK
jgi:hypothetical protein